MASNMNREKLIKEAKNMDPTDLIEKLNEDTANFIDQLPKGKKQHLWTLDDWDEQIQKHPFFMTKPPAEGEELPPLLEALQDLKYDPHENTPEELARSYKDDGNENFKKKKYRWAVDSYNQGLNTNCTDDELLVQLYSNRAAAQYHIGNYEKSLKDASAAKLIKENHLKALERGALCCLKLNRFSDCISWCEEGLSVCPENQLLMELKYKAQQKKKAEDRDRRKALVADSKLQKELEVIIKVIADRNIQLGNKSFEFKDVQAICPGAVSARVQLDENDRLIWPVLIMYPEYGTSDYIQAFHEDSLFLDHFKIMFENDPPGWDKEKKYITENLQVFFMDNEYVVQVSSTCTLKDAISHKRYKVFDGTPCFFVTVANSSFDANFRKKHNIME